MVAVVSGAFGGKAASVVGKPSRKLAGDRHTHLNVVRNLSPLHSFNGLKCSLLVK